MLLIAGKEGKAPKVNQQLNSEVRERAVGNNNWINEENCCSCHQASDNNWQAEKLTKSNNLRSLLPLSLRSFCTKCFVNLLVLLHVFFLVFVWVTGHHCSSSAPAFPNLFFLRTVMSAICCSISVPFVFLWEFLKRVFQGQTENRKIKNYTFKQYLIIIAFKISHFPSTLTPSNWMIGEQCIVDRIDHAMKSADWRRIPMSTIVQTLLWLEKDFEIDFSDPLLQSTLLQPKKWWHEKWGRRESSHISYCEMMKEIKYEKATWAWWNARREGWDASREFPPTHPKSLLASIAESKLV